MKKPSQNDRVVEYITKHRYITTHDAFIDLGITRLASRISDLKQSGYNISSKYIDVENRYGEKVSVKAYWFTNGGDPFASEPKGVFIDLEETVQDFFDNINAIHKEEQ